MEIRNWKLEIGDRISNFESPISNFHYAFLERNIIIRNGAGTRRTGSAPADVR
jgi:hypothetical protein